MGERGLHRLSGGALVDRDRAQAPVRSRRDEDTARRDPARDPGVPGSRGAGDDAARPRARRRGWSRRGSARAGEGGGLHRAGAGGGASRDAAPARSGGAHLLDRGLPVDRARHLHRIGVPVQSRRRQPLAGSLPRRAAGEREPVQRARPGRDPAAQDPLQRRVLRVGGSLGRRSVRLGEPTGDRRAGGGGDRDQDSGRRGGGGEPRSQCCVLARRGAHPRPGGRVRVRARGRRSRGGSRAGRARRRWSGVHRSHRAPAAALPGAVLRRAIAGPRRPRRGCPRGWRDGAQRLAPHRRRGPPARSDDVAMSSSPAMARWRGGSCRCCARPAPRWW